jgi:hypothetical protein
MRGLHSLTLSLALAAAATPGSAQVAPGAVVDTTGNGPVNPTHKPIVNKLKAPDTSGVRALTGESIRTLQPGVAGGSDGKSSGPTRQAYGAHRIPYTSTRVQLGSSSYNSTVGPNFLGTTTPYRQVGKLRTDQGDCTATLIRRSVIVTAAHCIQDFGSRSNIGSGFTFVPGYYGPGATAAQRAPYGEWRWAALWRPASWANGTDTGEGAARNNDIAVIILRKNSANRFLGDLIGWLGYSWNNYSYVASPLTGNLRVAAVSTLGYPSGIDDGEIMQRSDGPSYLTTESGALLMTQGSNFTTGASGGPWIVNFFSVAPVLAEGSVIGTHPNRAVIGVTSFGSGSPDDPNPNPEKDNYSSRFGQNKEFPLAAYGRFGAGNIGAALNSVCNQLVSPGVTYAAAGYCN